MGVYEEKIRMSTGFGRNINFQNKSEELMTPSASILVPGNVLLIPLRPCQLRRRDNFQ